MSKANITALFSSVLISALLSRSIWADSDKPVWNPTTQTLIHSYASSQTYKGQAYFKDENTWIYTPAFARMFRLPEQWISNELVGIEAAAFRIQPGDLNCGLAGKASNCRRWDQCITDVYIDESRHPLPWSTNQTADWLPTWDSARWLFRAEDGAPGVPYLEPGAIRPAAERTLVPWVDKKTGKVAMYYAETTQESGRGEAIRLLGYKRNILGNLTQLTFNYRCLWWNEKPYTPFRLELRKKGSSSPILRLYHEFRLPASFEKQIDTRLAEKNRREEMQFKQLLNVK